MAATIIVPVDEYLRTTYRPDMEYVDGQLVERNVGEWRHSVLQTLIIALLHGRLKGKFVTLTEQRVLVSSDPPRYRIPDVCVVARPYQPEPVLTRPPHLAIEITSPDDKIADILEKTAEYLKAGIAHVWMPDPYRYTLNVADMEGFRPCPNLSTGTDLVGEVDFGELFAELDQLEQ